MFLFRDLFKITKIDNCYRYIFNGVVKDEWMTGFLSIYSNYNNEIVEEALFFVANFTQHSPLF